MIDPLVHRFELPCPHCGQMDLQVIGEMVGKDEIACRFCGEMIDLSDEQWQTGLRKFIEGLRNIYITK